jgi:hypothetical protein
MKAQLPKHAHNSKEQSSSHQESVLLRMLSCQRIEIPLEKFSLRKETKIPFDFMFDHHLLDERRAGV